MDPISYGHRIGLIEVSKEDRNMTGNFENKVAVDGPVVNEGELGSSPRFPRARFQNRQARWDLRQRSAGDAQA